MNVTRVSLRNYMPASRCSRDQSKGRQFKSGILVTDLRRGLCALEGIIKHSLLWQITPIALIEAARRG